VDTGYLTILRLEFAAEDGTFMLQLRGGGLHWDRGAFTRLEQSKRAACVDYQTRDVFERWIAEGFYSSSKFMSEWTSHPNFSRPEPTDYYEACLGRVSDLCDWFFRGFHAYDEPHTWTDL